MSDGTAWIFRLLGVLGVELTVHAANPAFPHLWTQANGALRHRGLGCPAGMGT